MQTATCTPPEEKLGEPEYHALDFRSEANDAMTAVVTVDATAYPAETTYLDRLVAQHDEGLESDTDAWGAGNLMESEPHQELVSFSI